MARTAQPRARGHRGGPPEDPAGLIATWLTHEASLRRYVARRVGDASAVDDILQDVYLKAHQRFSTLEVPERAAHWLYRIAAHTVVDYYRRPPLPVELPDDLAGPVWDGTDVDGLVACVGSMVERLPTPYRDAVAWAELDGLGQREVAQRLAISLSGAKSRVQRGRRKLRQLIEECCEVTVGTHGIVRYEPRHQRAALDAASCCV